MTTLTKISIPVVILLLISNLLISQKQVRVGLKAGFNFTKLSASADNPINIPDDINYRAGIHAGFYSEFLLSNTVSMNMELLFSTKGYGSESSGASFNYIVVPVLLGIYLSDKFNIQFGPEIGYLVSDKSFASDFDFGLAGGFNYVLNNDTDKQITFGIRYIHGISGIFDSSVTDISGNPIDELEFKNRAFLLSVSYQLN